MICQNKVKICKLYSQNFKFSGQKIGCPSHHPTLLTFMKRLEKDMQIQITTLLQGVSGL